MAITESRSLPPQFVEDLGKDYATQLTGLTSQALDTNKISTYGGWSRPGTNRRL